MKKIIIVSLVFFSMPILLFSQLSILKIKFNEGYYSAPAHNAKLGFTAYVKNQDITQHINLQLYVKNLQNNQIFTSPIKPLISGGDSTFLIIDNIPVNYQNFDSYKFWIKYDVNSFVYYSDTLKLWSTNSFQSSLALDNSIYTEKNFTKISDTSSMNYTGIIANKFIFKNFSWKCPNGIAVAIGAGTTIGSQIKGALYKKNGNDFILINETNYYTVYPSDINTDSTNFPNLINLNFYINNQCLYKDSIYLAAIYYFGGDDTVFIIQDNSNFYQADSTVWFFNNNTYSFTPIYNIKNTPIIRLLFNNGNCSYGGIVNLNMNTVVLSGNSGSSQFINLFNNCNNISNIICKPWLSCFQSNQNLVVQSLSDNITGSPRYDTVMVYDNLGGNTFFRVTQLANIS